MDEFEKKDGTLLNILKDSIKPLKKTILPSLGIIIFICLIIAAFSLAIFPDLIWQLEQFKPQIDQISQWNDTNPNQPLPDELAQAQRSYTTTVFGNIILNSSMMFFPLIFLLLVVPGRVNYLHTKNEDGAKNWLESLKMPFGSTNQTYTALFLFLFYPFIIAVLIMLMYIPGFIFMIYCFFGFQSLVLDEKSGREVFRGGVFYAKENVSKIIVVLFLGIFAPMIIIHFSSGPILSALGFTSERYTEWITPSTRNYGMLYLYYFVNLVLQNFLYFWFPVVHTVAFDYIRKEKLNQIEKEERLALDTGKDKVVKIVVRRDQRYYHCKKCGKKLPVSAKKCARCGQLHRIMVPKKKPKSNK